MDMGMGHLGKGGMGMACNSERVEGLHGWRWIVARAESHNDWARRKEGALGCFKCPPIKSKAVVVKHQAGVGH